MKYICEKCGKEFSEYMDANDHEQICGLAENEIGTLVVASLKMLDKELKVERFVMPLERLSRRGGDKLPYFDGFDYHNEGPANNEKKIIRDLLFFALMREQEEARKYTNRGDWIVEQMGRQGP